MQIVLPIPLSKSSGELVSLWRGESSGRWGPDCFAYLKVLEPHLQNALKLRRALNASETRLNSLSAMLGQTSYAIFLLDSQGKVIERNEPAERMVRAGDGLRLRQERLTAVDAKSNRSLHQAIRQAHGAHNGGVADEMSFEIWRGSGKEPLTAVVDPIRVAGRSPGAATFALLRVSAPAAERRLSSGTLATLYGLTLAEADIANSLMSGATPAAIAEARRVTIGTLRMQLKSILRKTGSNRQSDLIRRLSALPHRVDESR